MSIHGSFVHSHNRHLPASDLKKERHLSEDVQSRHTIRTITVDFQTAIFTQICVRKERSRKSSKPSRDLCIRILPIQARGSRVPDREPSPAPSDDLQRFSQGRNENYETSIWDANGERWRRRQRSGNTAFKEPRTAVQEPSQIPRQTAFQQKRQRQGRQDGDYSRRNGPGQQPSNVNETWADEDAYKEERGWEDDEPGYGPFVFWNPLLREGLQSLRWAFPFGIFMLPLVLSNPVFFLLLPAVVFVVPPVRRALGPPCTRLWSTLLSLASKPTWESENSASQRYSGQNQNRYSSRKWPSKPRAEQPMGGFGSQSTEKRGTAYDNSRSTSSWDWEYPRSEGPGSPPVRDVKDRRSSDWFYSPPEDERGPNNAGGRSTGSWDQPSVRPTESNRPTTGDMRNHDSWDNPYVRSKEGLERRSGQGDARGGDGWEEDWSYYPPPSDWATDRDVNSLARGPGRSNAPERWNGLSDDSNASGNFRGAHQTAGRVKMLPAPGEGVASQERTEGGPQRGPYYGRVSMRVPRKRGNRLRDVSGSESESRRRPPEREGFAGETLGKVRPGWDKSTWDGDYPGRQEPRQRRRSNNVPDRQSQRSIMRWQQRNEPILFRLLFNVLPFLRSWGGFL